MSKEEEQQLTVIQLFNKMEVELKQHGFEYRSDGVYDTDDNLILATADYLRLLARFYKQNGHGVVNILCKLARPGDGD